MAAGPLLRRRWWIGLVVGLVVPFVLVSATLATMQIVAGPVESWSVDRLNTLTNLADIETWLVAVAATLGVLLTFRRWQFIALGLIFYVPLLWISVQLLQFGYACGVAHLPYACI